MPEEVSKKWFSRYTVVALRERLKISQEEVEIRMLSGKPLLGPAVGWGVEDHKTGSVTKCNDRIEADLLAAKLNGADI